MLTPGRLDPANQVACCLMLRHSQAALRAYLELPLPLVAHRAAADVAILEEVVKGVARLAGISTLQGLMTLEGLHKGSFQIYAGWSSLSNLCIVCNIPLAFSHHAYAVMLTYLLFQHCMLLACGGDAPIRLV